MTKENRANSGSDYNDPENIHDYQQTSPVNTGDNDNQNNMNIKNENPVTAQAEQVTAYAASSENKKKYKLFKI